MNQVLSVLLVFLHWRRLRAKPCPGPSRIKQVGLDDDDHGEDQDLVGKIHNKYFHDVDGDVRGGGKEDDYKN